MDYASTATGTEDGKPLLLMPDQDHPDTMNQIVWSLMNILEAQSIAGVPFDKTNETTYNRVRIAIQQMIDAAKVSKATLTEVREGTNDSKFVSPLGVTAASGNYSQYISVATTPAAIANTAMGGLIIASASASAITLPALAGVARIGAAYHFLNLSANTVSISRVASDLIVKENGTATEISLRSGNSVSLIKISETQWACVGSKQNDAPFQKEFVSGWTTYVSNKFSGTGWVTSEYTFPHGLGVIPKFMRMEWQCLIAEGGYSVGDIFETDTEQARKTDGYAAGHSTKKTATNIYIAFDNNHGTLLHDWVGDNYFLAANNKWQWRLKAYA
jgi:hypothetical protein